jgi:hypothetical protein
MRHLVLSALLLVLLPIGATAQRPADSSSTAGRDGTGEMSPRVSPAIGLHYGTPMRISGAVGVIIDLNKETLDGILLLAEPGQKGIEFAAGYLRMVGRFGSGFSVRAALLHTYDDPWQANPQTNYVGGEFHSMILFGLGARGGVFRRISGDPGPHDTLATLGLSIGI